MSNSLDDLLEEARIDKNFGIAATKKQDFEGAVKFFARAVERLKPYVPLESTGLGALTALEKQVASQLADCYGSLGGALRRNKEYVDSVQAYDNGFDIESNERFGIVNSYNRVQRLVARILAHDGLLDSPESLKQLPVPENKNVFSELVAAEQVIKGQLDGPRHGDRWAMADQAMTSLLIGDYEGADSAWKRFEDSKPSPEAYKANRDVIDLLRYKFSEGKMRTELDATYTRLTTS